MYKYLLIQTAIGDYRQNVLDCVVSELGTDFQILTGKEYFESTTITKVDLADNLSFIENLFFMNRKGLFQKRVLLKAIRSESLILEMNPRIINVWLILLFRRLLNKKTVLWGHAWPREGRYSRSDGLRNMLRRLGTHILVYTDTQKLELSERMPGKSITSAPNALYSQNEMWVPDRERINFVYVGRLIDTKKPRLMIEAYSLAIKKENIGDLIIVGSGPESDACIALVAKLGIASKVKFLGHIADLNKLRDIYSGCIASLSPGYVGLSITQSFSFGTPMLAADDEPHAPEIEAAEEGRNCCYFQANSSSDMSNKILKMWHDREFWKSSEPAIISNCRNNYSAELMSSRIVEAFEICKK
jgi:glycosyltransferase involved in cell wall biosynthesis